MDEAVGMEVVEAVGDVHETGKDVFEWHGSGVDSDGMIGVASGEPSESVFEIFVVCRGFGWVQDVVLEVSLVAELLERSVYACLSEMTYLEDKAKRDFGTEIVDLVIFKPNMLI
jgi:hypothetical protein